MGGGEIVNAGDYEDARCLGGLIAKEGWILSSNRFNQRNIKK